MSAEGYRSQPLSDELEHRIRERITLERNEGQKARVSALEWVLNEARALIESVPELPKPSRFEKYCHNCGHEHLDGEICNWPMGGEDRHCPCAQRRTA